MTLKDAWVYVLAHCLNETVMDDDETAKAAIQKIEDVLVPLIAVED